MRTKMYDGEYEAWCDARDKADEDFRKENPPQPNRSERPTLIPTGDEEDNLPF